MQVMSYMDFKHTREKVLTRVRSHWRSLDILTNLLNLHLLVDDDKRKRWLRTTVQ
jgi:hypothetical protein